MKKLYFILVCTFILLLASCTSTGIPKMYKWTGYENAAYKYLKKADQASLDELMEVYLAIISDQEGTLRETVPPGVCADYGYFLILAGNIEDGLVLLEKEVELYPESKALVDTVKEMVYEN